MGRGSAARTAFLFTAALATTVAAESDPPVLEEVADVTLVEVPLQVLGPTGTPLLGLGRDDFELLDNGLSQPLYRVREVDLENLGADDTTFLDRACPQSARRRLLLLFDLTRAVPAAVRTAADTLGALAWKDHLHPCDLVAVMTFEADAGPRLRLTWSADRGQLLRALNFRPQAAAPPPSAVDPLRFQASSVSGSFATGTAARPPGSLRGQTMLEHQRAITWMNGLEGIARMLADTPGIKTLALFTVGFDGRLLAGRAPPPPGPETLEVEESGARLRAETGDIRGLQGLHLFGSTELRQALSRFARELRQADTRLRIVNLEGLTSTLTSSGTDTRNGLAHLARGTGGELVTPGNDFAADLKSWLERSTVTYLLTFQPADSKADGRYHSLEVRLRGVRRRGVRLMHRAGYYAPRPFTELHPLEKSLLAADALLATRPRLELPFEVLLAPFRGDARTGYIPLLVEIPDTSRELEIYAYATDGEGRLHDHLDHRATIRSPVAGLKFYGHLELPVGEYRVRVLVRDALSGRTGVKSLALKVPDFGAGRPFLLPPFFPDPAERWQLAREPIDPQAPEIVYPFTIEGNPFIPTSRPALVIGEARELVLVLYNFGNAEVLSIEGSLLAADGTSQMARLKLVARVDRGQHVEKLRVLLTPADLEPGRYALEVAVRAQEGQRALSRLPVQILPSDRS